VRSLPFCASGLFHVLVLACSCSYLALWQSCIEQQQQQQQHLHSPCSATPPPSHRSPKDRHYSLAVYILLRGITLLIRTGNRPSAPPLLRALLAPTRMEHGDTLLMSLCCSQIIYAFIMYPQTLPASYVRFIQKQGAKEPYVYKGIQVGAVVDGLVVPGGAAAATWAHGRMAICM